MKNNRLKFRVVIDVEYGGENADDKSATLIINNAAVNSDGLCGFDIDELDKALERAGIDDEQDIDQIRQYLYDNSYVPDSDDYFLVDVNNILQSTGKTAADGRLIYDGDIIQDVDLRLYKYEVFWREYGWYVRRTNDHNNITSLYTFEPDNLEIVGSIYEPKVKTNENNELSENQMLWLSMELSSKCPHCDQDITIGPDNVCVWVGEQKLKENIEQPEPADPYAEQRKWIGKLCKFWDNSDEQENCVYDLLCNIFDPHYEDCPFQCGNGEWYEYCEPVKPNDDIIYKGE